MSETSAEHGPPSAGDSKWDPVIRNEATFLSFPKKMRTKENIGGIMLKRERKLKFRMEQSPSISQES